MVLERSKIIFARRCVATKAVIIVSPTRAAQRCLERNGLENFAMLFIIHYYILGGRPKVQPPIVAFVRF